MYFTDVITPAAAKGPNDLLTLHHSSIAKEVRSHVLQG